MGKKKHRKVYTSKGQRANVASKNLVKHSAIGNVMNKLDAWINGKSGFITVANPNKQETNRQFIKVPFNTFFGGSYKTVISRIKVAGDNEG